VSVYGNGGRLICDYTNDKDTVISFNESRIVFGDHTRILKLINFDFARGADGTQVLLSNNVNVPQHYFYHSLLKIDLSNYGYARHFKFLKQTRIIIPDYELATRYEETAKSFYDKIKHNIFETIQLEKLRDWLLPMLMKGQVTVNDA
jgi:type I restriction enzyme S subunit